MFLCIVLMMLPSASALASTATATSWTITPPGQSISYTLGAMVVRTNSYVKGYANTTPSPSANISSYQVNACILVGSTITKASGYIWNNKTGMFTVTTTLNSPSAGVGYCAMGKNNLRKGDGGYKVWNSNKTPSLYDSGTTSFEEPMSNSVHDRDGLDPYGDWYGINQRGEVYGTITMENKLNEMGLRLDLVYAMNEEGVYGFIRQAEIGAFLSSEAEIEAWIESQDMLDHTNLYASDGETILGVFSLNHEVINCD